MEECPCECLLNTVASKFVGDQWSKVQRKFYAKCPECMFLSGVIKPKARKYLAVPIDNSVKGMYPREYPGDLVVWRKKDDGPNGRAYLAKPMKRKIKPLWVLMRQVMQKPRPWWPDDMEVQSETVRFFRENFIEG